MRRDGLSTRYLFRCPSASVRPNASEGASGCDGDFGVRIAHQGNQLRYDLVSRADAAAGRRAHRGIRVSQQTQSDVTGQDNAELRRDRERGYQRRALNDLLRDQPGDGVRSLLTADSAERVERRDLFRHHGDRAIPDEPIAERRERGDGGDQASLTRLRRDRERVSERDVGDGGNQVSIGQAFGRNGRRRRTIRWPVEVRSVAEQVELHKAWHAFEVARDPEQGIARFGGRQ